MRHKKKPRVTTPEAHKTRLTEFAGSWDHPEKGQVDVYADTETALAIAVRSGLALTLAAVPPLTNHVAFGCAPIGDDRAAACWHTFAGPEKGWFAAIGHRAAVAGFVAIINSTVFHGSIPFPEGGAN